MSRLVAERLTVRRGGREILREVSLALPAGAFVAVVGPNGAGKSTLLAALAGLLAPDAGSVSLDGAPLARVALKALALRRAYLPQNPRCDWPISVERLVALGLTPSLPAFGGLPEGLARRVGAVLDAFDLSDRRAQPADTLSGGELARAMLARALVGDPQIVIADEPLTGLDPRHALDSVARLAALAADGKLVVASMHDLTLAARHATHVVALAEGRLAAFGTTAQVLTPATLQAIFGVEARVSGRGEAALIDFTGEKTAQSRTS